MKQIAINPNNRKYYSEDFIKGFKCGAERQFEADKADRPQDDDWEKYSDKLWKNAYERGKADRPQGEWIRDRYWSRGVGMGEEYGFFYKCSLCEYEVENGYTRCGFNFCPYCGASMKGADDE